MFISQFYGVPLADDAVRKAKESKNSVIKTKQTRKKRLRRQQEQQGVAEPWSNETFAYIAGYTENGDFLMVLHGKKWREFPIRKVLMLRFHHIISVHNYVKMRTA